jgi:hypothetical protein
MFDNLNPDSNITENNDLHSEKHSQDTISIDAGITILTKPVRWKALLRMLDNLNPDSNITKNSESHSEKHQFQRMPTLQFVTISRPIQI